MIDLLLTHGSYLVIILVLVVTGAGIPIPEEVPVITAGIMSSHGQLHPWLAFLACLVGALGGDCVMYAIGYHFGRSVLREHHYWVRLVTPEREAQMEEMVSRHGLKTLLLARFLVGLRSPVYLAAGILRLPFRRFFLFDLFCATVVIGTFFSLSYYCGLTITRWIRPAEIIATVVVVLVLLGGGIYLWRGRARRAASATSPSNSNDSSASSESDGEDGVADKEPVEHGTRGRW